MNPMFLLVIYLFLSTSQVLGDGDHAHGDHGAHGASDAKTSSAGENPTENKAPGGPSGQGTFTSVHTTSDNGNGGRTDQFSSILSSLSPELVSNLASNPQIAGALKSYGVDVGSVAAAKAAAEAGGTVPPPSGGGASGGYNYPPPPRGPLGGLGLGGLPGLGGGLPFFGGFGPWKNVHVEGDFGFYYPIVEKVIIVVGGGILILLILALLTKGFAKGGLFYDWGSSLSEAFAGSASLDLGPIHKSVAGAGAVNAGVGRRPFNPTPANMKLTQNVYDSLDRQF